MVRGVNPLLSTALFGCIVVTQCYSSGTHLRFPPSAPHAPMTPTWQSVSYCKPLPCRTAGGLPAFATPPPRPPLPLGRCALVDANFSTATISEKGRGKRTGAMRARMWRGFPLHASTQTSPKSVSRSRIIIRFHMYKVRRMVETVMLCNIQRFPKMNVFGGYNRGDS